MGWRSRTKTIPQHHLVDGKERKEERITGEKGESQTSAAWCYTGRRGSLNLLFITQHTTRWNSTPYRNAESAEPWTKSHKSSPSHKDFKPNKSSQVNVNAELEQGQGQPLKNPTSKTEVSWPHKAVSMTLNRANGRAPPQAYMMPSPHPWLYACCS